VLDILGAETEVIFAISGDGAFASFFGEVEIDAGEVLGKATVTVYASAEIGNYLNDGRVRALESSALASSNNTSRDLQLDTLLGADWDLDIDFDYQPPQWINDIGKAIAGFAQDAAKAIEQVWNDLSEFATDTFNAALELAKQLGEEISKIFSAVADVIGVVGDEVGGAIDAVAEFFGNNNIGPLEDLLGGVADVVDFAFDVLEASFDIGAKILSGDFDDIDDILWDLVSSSDYKRTKPTTVVGAFGCTKIIKGEFRYLDDWIRNVETLC